ncbi:MAG: histidine kinase dimerization/phospho-acceptor domain-containing protein, partial [Verrucomicrobiota bacterium]
MNIGKFRFGGRKRKRWALFVLLALAILEPIVCIVWLVRVATKNERMANQQLLEVSREDRVTAVTARLEREFSLFLDAIEEVRRENGRNAIHTLLQEKRANAFVDLEIEHPEWGGSEAEAAIRWAQERLALARNAESDTAKLEVLAEALADPRSQQSISRSGRSYAGLMALLAMELGGAQSIRERVDEVVFDFDAFSMRRQQRRLLLERHSEIFGSERSSLLAEAEAMSSALEEMSSTGRLESGGLGEFEGGYFMVDRLGGYVASLSKETFDSIVDRAMDFSEDSMGLTLQLHDPSALVGAVQRIIVLDKPLYGWRLSVDWDESEEGIAGSSFGYIGVVSIVIGFSIGIAVVLAGALRKEIAVAQLKNDLVATVSHELKTPVASIRLLVDTLNEKEELDTVRAKEYLQLISK